MAIAGVGPVPKDVVIATLGASTAIAGLVLVFIGMTVSSLQGVVRAFLSDTARVRGAAGDETRSDVDPVARAAAAGNLEAELLLQPDGLAGRVILILAGAALALFLSLADVGIALAWLAAPGGHLLYHVDIWLFVAALLSVAFLALATIDMSLRAATRIARY